MDKSVLLTDNNHRLTQASVVAAAPALATDGVDVTPWTVGGFVNRRAVVRLTGSAALSLTGIALWGYFDGKWSKLVGVAIADVTFVTGALVVAIVITEVVGSRLAVTGTPSAGTVVAELYTLETVTV